MVCAAWSDNVSDGNVRKWASMAKESRLDRNMVSKTVQIDLWNLWESEENACAFINFKRFLLHSKKWVPRWVIRSHKKYSMEKHSTQRTGMWGKQLRIWTIFRTIDSIEESISCQNRWFSIAKLVIALWVNAATILKPRTQHRTRTTATNRRVQRFILAFQDNWLPIPVLGCGVHRKRKTLSLLIQSGFYFKQFALQLGVDISRWVVKS